MIPHMPSPLSPGKTGSHLPRRSSTRFLLCEAVQKTPQTGKPPAAALSWTQSWQAFLPFVPSPDPAPALSHHRSPVATPKLFLSFHSYLSVSPPSFRHYASFYVHAAPFGTHACYSMLQHCSLAHIPVILCCSTARWHAYSPFHMCCSTARRPQATAESFR